MPTTEPLSDEAARKAALKRLQSHKTAVADLMDAVIEAKRLGIEIKTIAETAGIARSRVYRILDLAASIQRGLAQSATGEVHNLGDFVQYLDETARAANPTAIHHINGNPYDNRPENLEIVDLAAHTHPHPATSDTEETQR